MSEPNEVSEVPHREVPCRRCAGEGFVRVPDVADLKAMREAAGLSQSEVARRAGWQAGYVSELESGARRCGWAAAERYLNALRRLEES